MGMNALRPRLLFLLLTVVTASAQSPSPSPRSSPSPNPSPSPANNRPAPYWTAEVPGGKFTVALDAITSISQSTYIVDNSARVTEVSIGTAGSVQGRFYYIEPYTPQGPLASGQAQIDKLKSKVEEVLDRVSEDDPNTMVLKNFPATTHAHTVEFHISSLDHLNKLYGSLENALRTRREGKFKIP